jgi:hypothetical protein
MDVLPNHATIHRVVPKVCMGHYTREMRDVMKVYTVIINLAWLHLLFQIWGEITLAVLMGYTHGIANQEFVQGASLNTDSKSNDVSIRGKHISKTALTDTTCAQ